MKSNIENKKQLLLKKQKIATLDINAMSQINGGATESHTRSSSKNDITCCWCTSTITQP